MGGFLWITLEVLYDTLPYINPEQENDNFVSEECAIADDIPIGKEDDMSVEILPDTTFLYEPLPENNSASPNDSSEIEGTELSHGAPYDKEPESEIDYRMSEECTLADEDISLCESTSTEITPVVVASHETYNTYTLYDTYYTRKIEDIAAECERYVRSQEINELNSPNSTQQVVLIPSFENIGKFIIKENGTTAVTLQTKLHLSFFDACDIVAKLEQYGVIGSENGNLPRAVLMSLDDFDNLLSSGTIKDEDKSKLYKTSAPAYYDISEDKDINITITEENSTNYSSPYWKQPGNGERIKYEQENLDLVNVTIFFNNGIIYNVIPDVHCYYSARYYVIDGAFFDTHSIESVRSIPIPVFKSSGPLGTPVYNLEYLLKMRASQERDNKNTELSYALMYKSIDCMKASKLIYSKKDYMRFILWLYKDGLIDEAVSLEKQLRKELPEVFDRNITHKRIFLETLSLCDNDYIYCDWDSVTCAECAKYQNRVYCISGKDTSFPKLPPVVYEYGGFHPNCRHSFYAYNGGTITDKYGNQKDALEYSNRPFIDDRTPEEVQAYNQFIERKEHELKYENELKEFYILRHKLPGVLPKSYTTFEKYKENNSPKYTAIVKAAEEQGVTSPLL